VPGLAPADVEDVIMGCAMPEGEQGLNVARVIALNAGLPVTVPGQTVNRFCSSGLQTVANAAERIMAGFADVIVAGGVESMSAVPMSGHTPRPHPRDGLRAARPLHAHGQHGRDRRDPLRHHPRAAGRLRPVEPPEGAGGHPGRALRR
jgi:acetyl-CoA acetyltransferase